MNRACFLLLACLGWLGSGCSAITSRTLNRLSSPPPPLYFGGVRTDYKLIAEAKDSGSPRFWPVYGVVDMPFSFGADVLLLPYDVYTDRRHNESETADSKREESN